MPVSEMVAYTSDWYSGAFRASCFDGWRELLAEFESHPTWPTLSELEERWLVARGVTTRTGLPLRLVRDHKPRRRKKDRPLSEEYDVRVARGEVPTRERSWHDFFNVGAFARFPRIKAAIHAENAECLEVERAHRAALPEVGVVGRRSRVRDTRALLDEGGVLLATAPRAVEVARRELAAGNTGALRELAARGELRPWVLGHALLEHAARSALGERLGAPPRGLTWVVACDPEDVGSLDVGFAAELATKDVLREPPAWLGHSLSVWFSDVAGASSTLRPLGQGRMT